MKDIGITMSEWLAELSRLCPSDRNDPGKTLTEIGEELGCCEHRVRKFLRAARAAGRLKVGERTEEKLNGKGTYTVDVYSLLPTKRKAK